MGARPDEWSWTSHLPHLRRGTDCSFDGLDRQVGHLPIKTAHELPRRRLVAVQRHERFERCALQRHLRSFSVRECCLHSRARGTDGSNGVVYIHDATVGVTGRVARRQCGRPVESAAGTVTRSLSDPRQRAPNGQNAHMTRYVISPDVALRLAVDNAEVRSEHNLVAPTLLRSQLLASLFEAVQRRDMTKKEADGYLDYVRGLRIRLLGDRVLQNTAWKVAAELGWDDTYDAEYIALTQLQADAFITLDKDLAKAAKQMVTLASIKDLT